MMTNLTCCHCGADNIAFGIHRNLSGSITIIAKCECCGKVPEKNHHFYKKALFTADELDNMEIWRDDVGESTPCEMCGQQIGSFFHHYAPRHLFGDTADKWATGYLCKEHHEEWHKKTRTGAYYGRA